jgi:hypothetical protein
MLKLGDRMRKKGILVTVILTLTSATYGQKMFSAKGYFCGQTEPD